MSTALVREKPLFRKVELREILRAKKFLGRREWVKFLSLLVEAKRLRQECPGKGVQE